MPTYRPPLYIISRRNLASGGLAEKRREVASTLLPKPRRKQLATISYSLLRCWQAERLPYNGLSNPQAVLLL
jgi:hypothetical protein